jgi:ABC-type multidrug transport system fused ATPase/permease subunit
MKENYINKRKKELIVIIALTSVSNFLNLAQNYLDKPIIDELSAGKFPAFPLFLIAVFLMINIFLDYYAYTYLLTILKLKITQDIRFDTFKNIIRQNMTFFKVQSRGSLVARAIDDPTQIGDYLGLYHFIYVGNTIRAVVTYGLLFYLNVPLALLTLLSLPLFYWLMKRQSPKIATLNDQERQQYDQILGATETSFSNVRTLKASELVEQNKKYYEQLLVAQIKAKEAVLIQEGLMTTTKNLIQHIMPIIVLGLGSYFVVTGQQLTVGSLFAFLAILGAAYIPVSEMIYFQTVAAKTKVYLNRFDEFSTVSSAMKSSASSATPSVQVSHLTKRIGQSLIFQDVTFHIEKSGIYGFVARNGAGKSTIFDILTGLDEAEGEVVVTGKMAYLPQESPVFGFDNHRSESSNSGGEKRKMAFSRLDLSADILLLDEPFEGLDQQAQKQLADQIIALAQSKIIIVIDHHDILKPHYADDTLNL